MRSLARDFSSSRRAPPKAASKPYLFNACFRPSVFMMSVCLALPCTNGLMPIATPSGFYAPAARSRTLSRCDRGTRTFRGTSSRYRRAAAGTAACREERLARQMQHHGRVFADGVKHHRVGEFSGDFTDDMDTLRLQLPQMSESFFVHNRPKSLAYAKFTTAGRAAPSVCD